VLLSALPSSFLLWVASMALRLLGSLDGMESAAEVARKGVDIQTQARSFWTSLSQRMDNSMLGSVVKKLDPYDLKATANLSRLLILWPEPNVWQRIAMQGPEIANMMNHPRVIELGDDPAVRKLISARDFAGLMQLRKVEEAASHPDIEPVLSGLDLEQAMDTLIYQRPQPVRLRP
jgi:hypothetical protein